jgi:hypothetical protein
VIRRNGWVTSPPGVRKLRIELPESISVQVIDELKGMKFQVEHIGQGTRLWFERQVPVDIYMKSQYMKSQSNNLAVLT